jgi:hypothetical protein
LRTTETPGLGLVTAGCYQPDQTTEAQGLREPASTSRSSVASEPAEADFESRRAGQLQDQDLSRLGSRQFRSVLDTLRELGRHIVYDLPTVGAHETVLEAAASLGNVILVARSGQTTRVQLREAAQMLEDRGANVCGILITDVRTDLLEGAPLFPAHRKRPELRRWLRRSPPAAAAHRVSAAARDPDSQPNPEPEPHAN